MMRIELTLSAWKAEALPLCNIRLAGNPGFEPGTTRLTVEGSAAELIPITYKSILNKVRIEKCAEKCFDEKRPI